MLVPDTTIGGCLERATTSRASQVMDFRDMIVMLMVSIFLIQK